MNNVLSPELLQLIEGLKPYLGSQGKSVAETMLKVANAISSQPVREAYQEVSNLLPQLSGKIFKPLTDKLAGQPKKKLRLLPDEMKNRNQEDVSSGTPAKTKQKPDIQGLFANNFSLILFLILILLFYGDGAW